LEWIKHRRDEQNDGKQRYQSATEWPAHFFATPLWH
jgi:hypothetical protein